MKNNKDTDNNNLNLLLSKIPSIEIILQNKALKPLIQKHSRKMLTQMVRKVISEEKKNALKNGHLHSAQERINKIKEYFKKENLSFLQEVINGSGVILHTNLGRAPLGKEMLAAVQSSLQGYTNLEYDRGRIPHSGDIRTKQCSSSRSRHHQPNLYRGLRKSN